MRKHLSTIILVAIMLAGLSLLLYPTFSDWWNQFHQSRAIASYTQTVANLDTGESERMLDAAAAYNQALWTSPARYKPTEEEHETYLNTLDVTGTGIMGYINIPKINVSLPIYHGTDEGVLQVAVGHIEGSSLPVGGAGTHCVLSGHRGLPSARLFTDLDDIIEGDIFTLEVLNETFTYRVDQIRIVLPEELDDLALFEGKDYCTLVTCTPYGVNSHRLLVRGTRIANLAEEETIIVEADATMLDPYIVAPVLGGMLLILLLLAMRLHDSQRRHQAKQLEKARKTTQKPNGEDTQ